MAQGLQLSAHLMVQVSLQLNSQRPIVALEALKSCAQQPEFSEVQI